MSRLHVEVIKIGGSLFSRPDFVPAMQRLLHDYQRDCKPGHRVFIVGGGPLVDALRGLDGEQPTDDVKTHWRAIELMDIAGKWVADRVPGLILVDSYKLLVQRCGGPGETLFLTSQFLKRVEPTLPGLRLGYGWCVSSDSIAARVAYSLAANRLRLYKSRPALPEEQSNLARASQQGLVDESFAQLAAGLAEVEFCLLPAGPQPGGSVGQ